MLLFHEVTKKVLNATWFVLFNTFISMPRLINDFNSIIAYMCIVELLTR